MKNLVKKIIRTLLDVHDYMTADELARIVNVSVSSIKHNIKDVREELKKYDILSKEDNSILSKSFLRRIGFFLKDQRMIILIVSEFHTYLKILDSGNKKDIDSELLFSMIVYKNFYAEDLIKLALKKLA